MIGYDEVGYKMIDKIRYDKVRYDTTSNAIPYVTNDTISYDTMQFVDPITRIQTSEGHLLR